MQIHFGEIHFVVAQDRGLSLAESAWRLRVYNFLVNFETHAKFRLASPRAVSLRVAIAAATVSFGVLAEAVRELLQAEFEHRVGRGLWEGERKKGGGIALVKCVVNIRNNIWNYFYKL